MISEGMRRTKVYNDDGVCSGSGGDGKAGEANQCQNWCAAAACCSATAVSPVPTVLVIIQPR